MTVTEEYLKLWARCFVLDPSVPSGICWNEDLPYIRKLPMAGSLSGRYYQVEIQGRRVQCHRIVLALNGILPKPGETVADHIDRNSLNNAVSNLRWCTASVNEKNKKTRNPTGFKHVRAKANGRWRAYYWCPILRRKRHAGTYDTPYEAHIAALAHRLEHHWIDR